MTQNKLKKNKLKKDFQICTDKVIFKKIHDEFS